jgi:hypothetical protein
MQGPVRRITIWMLLHETKNNYQKQSDAPETKPGSPLCLKTSVLDVRRHHNGARGGVEPPHPFWFTQELVIQGLAWSLSQKSQVQ